MTVGGEAEDGKMKRPLNAGVDLDSKLQNTAHMIHLLSTKSVQKEQILAQIAFDWR